jgi:hypothetical protein
MKITAVRPKIPQRPAKPGLNAGRIRPIGKPVSRRCASLPGPRLRLYGQDNRAHGLALSARAGRRRPRAWVRESSSASFGAPTPHLSQFPNESVPMRTVSLAGFGNGVSCVCEFFDECSEMRGDAYSAYGQARALRRLFAVRRVLSNVI